MVPANSTLICFISTYYTHHKTLVKTLPFSFHAEHSKLQFHKTKHSTSLSAAGISPPFPISLFPARHATSHWGQLVYLKKLAKHVLQNCPSSSGQFTPPLHESLVPMKPKGSEFQGQHHINPRNITKCCFKK